MASAPTCPTAQTLDDLMANRLPADTADEVRRHYAACPKCNAALGEAPPAPAYPFLEPARAAGEVARLGSYRVLGLLGEGGMGIVFEAEDDRLHRKVALKVLRPENSTAEMRERFLREARVLASLPHDHIVGVFEVGEANGVPFLAMERLEGTTLEGRLRQERTLPLDESLSIARQVAEGLQEVHEKDLVHRDVKPANIWLETTPDGRPRRVKLLDFGIARRAGGEKGLTVSGSVVGTPSYMAPEQALGLPVDRRADLYALGCVLYRMLVGTPPFDGSPGETMSLLAAVIKGDAPAIGAAAPHLPAGVARLIQRLLARAPSERPASARELAAELRRLEGGPRDALAPPPSSPTRRLSLMRRPGASGIALGAAVILLAVAIGVAAVSSVFRPPPADAQPLRVGLLHTLNGPLAVHEKPVVNATQFAIDELNAAGGVLGRQVQVILRDGNGREEVFAEQARDLLENENVDVIFGCWAAAGRKRVEKLCEEHDRFLFFSVGYEGLEDSPAVVYLGGTPNQTIIPLVRWAYADLGKRRFLLLGTEDIYSRGVNAVLKHELDALGATSFEHYLTVGDDHFGPACAEAVEKKIDFIVNTIDGTINATLLSDLRRSGLRPPAVPTAWLSLSESELSQFPAQQMVGDYTSGGYFEHIDLPQNRDFVRRFQARFRGDRVNDAMETAYFGVHLWKKAVEKARTAETAAVRQALVGMYVDAPEGTVRLADGRHVFRTARVGKLTLDGSRPQFEVVYTTPGPIAPEPYPPWRTREQWHAFVDGLYRGWGGRWEKQR